MKFFANDFPRQKCVLTHFVLVQFDAWKTWRYGDAICSAIMSKGHLSDRDHWSENRGPLHTYRQAFGATHVPVEVRNAFGTFFDLKYILNVTSTGETGVQTYIRNATLQESAGSFPGELILKLQGFRNLTPRHHFTF